MQATRFAGNANPFLELLFGSLIALCVLGITLVISFVLRRSKIITQILLGDK